MNQKKSLSKPIQLIIVFHVVNSILWTIGQGGAVAAYDTVAEWGLQGPRQLLDPVIVEVNRAIGLADLILMIPLFLIAVFGLVKRKRIGAVASWLVFGISAYWPIVFFASQNLYRVAGITYQPASPSVIAVPLMILIFSLWGSRYLFKHYDEFT